MIKLLIVDADAVVFILITVRITTLQLINTFILYSFITLVFLYEASHVHLQILNE